MNVAPRDRLGFSTIGAVSSTLAAELAPHADLSTSGTGEDGFLFDGTVVADADALKSAFDSGRLVTVARPSPDHLGMLLAITGTATPEGVDAVIYQTLPAGGYGCRHLLPIREREPAFATSPLVELGAWLLRMLRGHVSSVPIPAAMLANNGSLAGYATFSNPGTGTQWPMPNANGPFDDTVVQTPQPADFPYDLTFFVYYVNGGTDPGFVPYFSVFVSIQGTSLCAPIANYGNNRGWFRPSLSVSIGGFTGGVNSSPPSGDASNGIDVVLQDSFPLLGNLSTGFGSYTFNPQIGQRLTYPQWSFAAESDVFFPDSYGWRLYQTSPWDVLQNDPSTSSLPIGEVDGNAPWMSSLYDASNDVVDMSDVAIADLSYQMLAEWQVQIFNTPKPPYDVAPSLPVTFRLAVTTLLVLMHNTAGCTGAFPPLGQANHIWWNVLTNAVNGYAPAYKIDLGKIANSQNLTQPS